MKKRREFFFLLPLFFFHQKKKKKDRSSKRPKGKNMSFCGKKIIPSETRRKGSVCIHILVREYLKELTPSLGCTFQKKKILSLPSELSSFFEFSLSCPSTQEDLLVATPPRVKINLSLQNFLSFSDIYPSLVFYPFSFLKEGKKKIRRRTFMYYTFSLVKR